MNSTNDSSAAQEALSRAGARLDAWLLFVPIAVFAATRELWAPDEPRYAEVAREAYESGSLLVMHLNGALYPDKPPLLYWLAGFFGSIFGWSEFAMRIPSLAATAGSAWLTARLARRYWGELEAAWAGPFYLGTAMVMEIGGRIQIDPLLSFLCLSSLMLATSHAPEPQRATRNLWVAGICAGLAALAKGPAAWVHVVFVLLVWRFLPRAARVDLPRSRAGWTGFALLAILPVASWAVLASVSEPALWKPLFYGQHLGRVYEGTQHAGPPWYHVAHLPYLVLPWTPLFALALWRSWRALRGTAPADVGRVRALSWFLVILLTFSVITPKRDLYLLPLYPAIALLCARELAEAQRSGALPRWVRIASPVLLLIAALGLFAAPFFAEELLPYRGPGAAIGIAFALSAVAALAFERRSIITGWAHSIFRGFALAFLVFALLLVPRINPDKSARQIAEFLASRPEKPTSIACAGVQPEGFRFYGGVATAREPIADALEREGSQFLGLVNQNYYDALTPEVRARVRILVAQRSRDVIVIGAALPGQEDAKAGAPGG